MTAPRLVVSASTVLYATTFPADEQPLREGGMWVNGGTDGLRWTDVRTQGGRAWGLQVGPQYTDATALLTGPWPADQYAEAVVFQDRVANPNCHEEVELRLRSAIAPNVNRGYEIIFKARKDSQSGVRVYRWYGPFGKFQRIALMNGITYGVVTGDTVRAEVQGSTIRVYRNRVLKLTVVDTLWADGAPGIGFNLVNSYPGCAGRNADYGFTDFAAGSLP